MKDQSTAAEEWVPEALVRVYRGGHLIEQRVCSDPEKVAEIVESWEADPPPAGGEIVVKPYPPSAIVELLRAIADAIEQERPVPMHHPLPQLRLQLATEAIEPGATRSPLSLLVQELAHPGD
jgi:hypothetical protein